MRNAFVFRQDQDDYVLKLRRRFSWWWLLLLLLPLLLLIRFDKTVHVLVIDEASKQPIAGAEVHFAHEAAYIYKDGKLPLFDTVRSVATTGADGKVTFQKRGYSVFSWIFRHGSLAEVTAVDGCYGSDTARVKFHSLSDDDVITLVLKPEMMELDFRTIDAADGEPLPGVMVEAVSEIGGKQYTDSQRTDACGRVVFKALPKCGKLIRATGSLYGYFPDSIVNRQIKDILGPLDSLRRLRLQPVRKPIDFYVTDCATGKPVGNAKVEIVLSVDGKKIMKTVPTNIDGHGKYAYDAAHIIAKIQLIGSAAYYKRKVWDQEPLVSDFIDSTKYPKSKRTFCLDPDPNPLIFRNTDCLNGNSLTGVKNEVTIVDASGKERKETVLSGRDGTFQVSINPDDKISVVAQYPPNYEDNNTTIQQEDGIGLLSSSPQKRIICLKPKMVTLVFRTVDGNNPSQLVPDAVLVVTVNGQTVSPPNSRNGEFQVQTPISASISIVASKAGYGTNSSKINSVFVRDLVKAKQNARDIPLAKDPPPPNKPCKSGSSGSSGDKDVSVDLGDPKARFRIEFDMDSAPDAVTIFCGDPSSNNILWEHAPFKEEEVAGPTIDLGANGCGSSTITLRFRSESGKGTNWSYKIFCQ